MRSVIDRNVVMRRILVVSIELSRACSPLCNVLKFVVSWELSRYLEHTFIRNRHPTILNLEMLCEIWNFHGYANMFMLFWFVKPCILIAVHPHFEREIWPHYQDWMIESPQFRTKLCRARMQVLSICWVFPCWNSRIPVQRTEIREELYTLYKSRNIIGVLKSWSMGWTCTTEGISKAENQNKNTGWFKMMDSISYGFTVQLSPSFLITLYYRKTAKKKGFLNIF